MSLKKPKVLAVILARGGSKGIPKKNIIDLNGHPLMSYSIHASLNCNLISKTIVSTDDIKIAKIANAYGAETPFLRSKFLSRDKTTSADSLRDAVLKTENYFKTKYDYVVELPCVAPFRTSEDIEKSIKKLILEKYDSVISYVATGEKHPTRLKRIKGNFVENFCKEFPESKKHSRRQDFEPCYIRNGVKMKNREGNISAPFIMPIEKSINIDEKFDLEIARLMCENGMNKNFPSKKNFNTIYKFKNQKKIKLLVTAPLHFLESTKDELNKKYDLIVLKHDEKKFVEKLLKETDIWICSPCPKYKIDKSILNFAKNLKIIATPSTGSNHIDKVYCKKNNIKVIALKGTKFIKSISASSEYTFAMILSSIRKIPQSINAVKSNYWRDYENLLRGNELSNLTLGIIGYGRIGSNLARYAKSFKMKILVNDPYKKFNKIKIKNTNINLLLKDSDIVVVCVHLNEKTRNMVNENFFKRMKKGVIFINSSRGEIVNEKMLIKYLKNKKIKSCFLDVVTNENLEKKNFFKKQIFDYMRQNKNLHISPHIAGLTYESENKAMKSILKLISNETKNS